MPTCGATPSSRWDGEIEQWIEDYASDAQAERVGASLGLSAAHRVLPGDSGTRHTGELSQSRAGARPGSCRGCARRADDALAAACRLIAVDEAAHYAFFVEVARLFLYYEPEASLEALVDVLRHFTMPARNVIPNYDEFGRVLHDAGVFGRSIHYRDVVRVVLDTLSAPAPQRAGSRSCAARARFPAPTALAGRRRSSTR